MYLNPNSIRTNYNLLMDDFVAQTIKKVVILDNSPIRRSKKFTGKNQELTRARCEYFLFTSIFTGIEFNRNIVAQNKICIPEF